MMNVVGWAPSPLPHTLEFVELVPELAILLFDFELHFGELLDFVGLLFDPLECDSGEDPERGVGGE